MDPFRGTARSSGVEPHGVPTMTIAALFVANTLSLGAAYLAIRRLSGGMVPQRVRSSVRQRKG
jgi:hypothetical protein